MIVNDGLFAIAVNMWQVIIRTKDTNCVTTFSGVEQERFLVYWTTTTRH